MLALMSCCSNNELDIDLCTLNAVIMFALLCPLVDSLTNEFNVPSARS
jgi:hypothetical protein